MSDVMRVLARSAFKRNKTSDVTYEVFYANTNILINPAEKYPKPYAVADPFAFVFAKNLYLDCVPIYSNEVKRFRYKLPE